MTGKMPRLRSYKARYPVSSMIAKNVTKNRKVNQQKRPVAEAFGLLTHAPAYKVTPSLLMPTVAKQAGASQPRQSLRAFPSAAYKRQ